MELAPSVNLELYQKYAPNTLDLPSATAYDRAFVKLRLGLLSKFAPGKSVLDLCCGTGSYSLPILGTVKSLTGVDFCDHMLGEFKNRTPKKYLSKLSLIEADARRLPLEDGTFDFIFSFCSLYHVPDIAEVYREIFRVSRPGAIVVLEIGNQISLNTLVTSIQHRRLGWAKQTAKPFYKMDRIAREAGFSILQKEYAQLLPMYGAPPELVPLYPLFSPAWKRVMGLNVRGRMLDQWVSGLWPLRHFAFRQIVVMKKQ